MDSCVPNTISISFLWFPFRLFCHHTLIPFLHFFSFSMFLIPSFQTGPDLLLFSFSVKIATNILGFQLPFTCQLAHIFILQQRTRQIQNSCVPAPLPSTWGRRPPLPQIFFSHRWWRERGNKSLLSPTTINNEPYKFEIVITIGVSLLQVGFLLQSTKLFSRRWS